MFTLSELHRIGAIYSDFYIFSLNDFKTLKLNSTDNLCLLSHSYECCITLTYFNYEHKLDNTRFILVFNETKYEWINIGGDEPDDDAIPLTRENIAGVLPLLFEAVNQFFWEENLSYTCQNHLLLPCREEIFEPVVSLEVQCERFERVKYSPFASTASIASSSSTTSSTVATSSSSPKPLAPPLYTLSRWIMAVDRSHEAFVIRNNLLGITDEFPSHTLLPMEKATYFLNSICSPEIRRTSAENATTEVVKCKWLGTQDYRRIYFKYPSMLDIISPIEIRNAFMEDFITSVEQYKWGDSVAQKFDQCLLYKARHYYDEYQELAYMPEGTWGRNVTQVYGTDQEFYLKDWTFIYQLYQRHELFYFRKYIEGAGGAIRQYTVLSEEIGFYVSQYLTLRDAAALACTSRAANGRARQGLDDLRPSSDLSSTLFSKGIGYASQYLTLNDAAALACTSKAASERARQGLNIQVPAMPVSSDLSRTSRTPGTSSTGVVSLSIFATAVSRADVTTTAETPVLR